MNKTYTAKEIWDALAVQEVGGFAEQIDGVFGHFTGSGGHMFLNCDETWLSRDEWHSLKSFLRDQDGTEFTLTE